MTHQLVAFNLTDMMTNAKVDSSTLARMIGVHPSTVRRWLNGSRKLQGAYLDQVRQVLCPAVDYRVIHKILTALGGSSIAFKGHYVSWSNGGKTLKARVTAFQIPVAAQNHAVDETFPEVFM